MPTHVIPVEDRQAVVAGENRDSDIAAEIRVTRVFDIRTAVVTR